LADIDYRPRSASEILDASFNLLRDHYRSFVTLSAIAYFPLAAFSLLFARYAGISQDPQTAKFDLNVVILLLVQAVLFQLMTGVVAIMASRAYVGDDLDPSSTWKIALPRLPAIVFTGLIVLISCFIGFIFLIFPAIYLYTRYGLGPMVAAIEGTGTTISLSRSTSLSKGHKLHIFGVTLLILILWFMLSIGLGLLSTIISSFVIKTSLGYLSTVLVWPLLPTVQTVLYYDLRIRAEGYDVDLMSRRLDSAPAMSAEPAI
jgi:uncharacterized membrane protein